MAKFAVAYETPRRKSTLKWHRVEGGGLKAKGRRGVYRIAMQKPNRRMGVYRWGLRLGSEAPFKSDDDLTALKDFAAAFDMAVCREDDTGDGGKSSKSGRPGAYTTKVIAALRMMGSPTPEKDAEDAAKYIAGQEAAGTSPAIAAAVIDATRHHVHKPTESHFAKESSARETILIENLMHNPMHKERENPIASSPTREEWEVIVRNVPQAHRGAIIGAVPPGDAEVFGSTIMLRGFHDDTEAANVAHAITKRYGIFVSFGPRRAAMAAEGGGSGPLA